MTSNNLKIESAFITGAAHGIGAAFARKLAAENARLWLVDKEHDALMALTEELRTRGATAVEPIVANLANSTDQDSLVDILRNLTHLDLLINNAGFGKPGSFHDQLPEIILEMLHVHMNAPARFSHAALPAMIARRKGAIINVCSLAQSLPFSGLYGATKTFLYTFSKMLHRDVSKHGIKIQALVPGYTSTAFHNAGHYVGEKHRIPNFLWSSADVVAGVSLRDLSSAKFECVPGALNRCMAFILRHGLYSSRLAQRWVV